MVDPINISDALARTMELLESGDYTAAAAYLRGLHPADSAEVIADLEPEEQAHIASLLGPEELAGILEQLDEEEMVEVAEHLDVETLADVLDAMEPDMAADLLGEIEDENVVNELLEEMEESEEDRLDMGFDVRPYSRLGCQVKVPGDPEDLVVEISEESIATWYNEHPEHRHEQHKKGVPA